MKILVTGGNGFIGKHVVKNLASNGMDVISFDIIKPVEEVAGVKYVEGSIMDEFALGRCMRGCDAVFHLAAILGVRRADAELLRCMVVNINGTMKVLEACVLNKVPRVLITSSSEIFGDIGGGGLHEDSPFNPKSGYAVTKLAAEHVVKGFKQEYDLDYNIVRFFNVYGPGQVAEFVIPRFIKTIQKGISPKIYGDGSQVRSFCYIQDAARAVLDIFLDENSRNHTFNVGNDLEPITVSELANKIVEKINNKLKPEFIPFSQSDRHGSREIYHRIPDISKTRKVIGFEPRISLDEGINKVIQANDIPDSWVEPID